MTRNRSQSPSAPRGRPARVGLAALFALLLIWGIGCGGGSEVKTRSAPVGPVLISADANGDIYNVDRGNGRTALRLNTFLTGGGELERISSIALDPVTDRFFEGTGGGATCVGCIYAVNRNTGEVLFSADNSGIGSEAAGMTVASDGTILATYLPGPQLVDIDPITGAATVIGTPAVTGGGDALAFDLGGNLYHADTVDLHRLDPLTGAVLTTTPLNYSGFPALGASPPMLAMATHPVEDRLYGILQDVAAAPPAAYLVTVHPGTGLVVNCGETQADLDGLAFLPAESRYVTVPPDPPQNVSAFGRNGAIELSWDMSCVPASYNIYIGPTPQVGPGFNPPSAVSLVPPFLDAPLSNGVTRYYAVTAVNEGGESDPTAPVSATTTNQITFIPFAAETASFPGAGPTLDEALSGPHPIGFAFTFFGIAYSDFHISSNGFITFNATSDIGCCAGAAIPLADLVNNMIALAWTDLDPSLGGAIGWETRGTSPNQRLVVDFAAVANVGTGTVTVQAILYEGNNAIEIHTANIDPGQVVTQGVENAAGTAARADPEHVASDFSLSAHAVRFRTN